MDIPEALKELEKIRADSDRKIRLLKLIQALKTEDTDSIKIVVVGKTLGEYDGLGEFCFPDLGVGLLDLAERMYEAG